MSDLFNHPVLPPDWRRALCLACSELVKRNRGGWAEICGTPDGSWLSAMPTEAGRGLATDTEQLPISDVYLLGAAHHRCVDRSFLRIISGEVTFGPGMPVVRVDSPPADQMPKLWLPSGRVVCPFCDRLNGAPMTEEHVWPEWFQRELVRLGGRFPENGPGRETSPLGPTVPVCAECNNRWLSVLDNDVKPILVDIWRHRRFLEPDEQELLATWATGRAAVIDAHQAKPLLPQFFAHELRVSRKPAKGTWVWATGFIGPSRWMHVWYRPLRLKPRVGPAPEEPNGLCVTFTAFRVAFQVVFTFWRGTYDVALNYDVEDSLTPLSSVDGHARLFPAGAFDFEAIIDVSERFPHGEPTEPEPRSVDHVAG